MSDLLFDSTLTLALTIPRNGKVERATLRWPTDTEWLERERSRKTIEKNLGRGQKESKTIGGEEADLRLYEKIRIDGPDLDGYEAMSLISQLAAAEVLDCEHVSGGFDVRMRVIGGEVVHHLRMPSQKQVIDFQRAFVRARDLPFGQREYRINPQAGTELYDALLESTEGYAGSIPCIHKPFAVDAAIKGLDLLTAEVNEQNFTEAATPKASPPVTTT